LPIQGQLYASGVSQAEGKALLGCPRDRLTRVQEEPFHGLIINGDMEPRLCFGLDAKTVERPP